MSEDTSGPRPQGQQRPAGPWLVGAALLCLGASAVMWVQTRVEIARLGDSVRTVPRSVAISARVCTHITALAPRQSSAAPTSQGPAVVRWSGPWAKAPGPGGVLSSELGPWAWGLGPDVS